MARHTGDVPADEPLTAGSRLREHLDAAPPHGSATDAVTDALREAILDGSLTPSGWLREDDLARELSVSRTPVREALRRLSDEGLTLRDAHRGTRVAPMSLDDILAVYLVRESLEGLAARSAAQRRPPGLVESLTRVHQKMAARGDDAKALASLNVEFHRLLRDASGNPYLERFLTQVEHAVRRFGHSTYELAGRTEEALAEHHAIVTAVAAGDAEAAAREATRHMRMARDARIKAALGG